MSLNRNKSDILSTMKLTQFEKEKKMLSSKRRETLEDMF